MSAEEKNPLLSKIDGEEVTEVPSPRPEVPMVDYSKKTFYDYLGLKSDASDETLKSTAAELKKKYNPITNPDEIDKYQNVDRSDRILNTGNLKKFYDDYGDLSILLYEVIQHYLQYPIEGNPKSFISMMLVASFFILLLVFLTVFLVIVKYFGYFVGSSFKALIPSFLLVVIYLVVVVLRYTKDISLVSGEGEKKEKKLSEIKKRDCTSIIKSLLLIIFQVLIGRYYDKGENGCFICAVAPYLLFEAVVLCQDFIKYKAGVEGINTGKDVDNILLRGNNFVKYLIGINNTKCEVNKEGKKGACASTATGLLALHIFKTDVLRLVQNVLFFISYKINPPCYIIFYIPTVLMSIVTVAEMVLQGKIGYVRSTCESVISIFWAIIYFVIDFDLIFTFCAVDLKTLDFVNHSYIFLIELVLLGGFFVGVLPFVPIIEFKLKHDETDVPY